MSITVEIEKYFDRLWPICRSILGPGIRESLNILSEIMPMDFLRFGTGEKILDWTVPDEWVPRDAYLLDSTGRKWGDFSANNLHLLGYSVPFRGRLSFEELSSHLYSIPDQPDAIPYLTSYYEPRWGFCVSQKEMQQMPRGEYDVVVDTALTPGTLVIGESVLPGDTSEEVLFSSYLCHPSMANNELSGPLVLAFLYRAIAKLPHRRYTYRFALMPETIGTIAFLSKRGSHLKQKLVAGYQLTCIGDGGDWTYKASRRVDSLADRTAQLVFRQHGNSNFVPFNPAIGSDERQYCSPGFNLPVGSIMRTMYTRFPEYHTSLDNKSMMSFKGMEATIDLCLEIVRAIEANQKWRNKFPYGEPQLGKRGLFRSLSGKNRESNELAMWWLLNYCDGEHDLLGIAELSGQTPDTLNKVANHLCSAGVLEPCMEPAQ